DRVLVEERVVVEPSEALDQGQVFVPAPSEAAQAHRTGTFAAEVLCLDDERIAFPAAARVSSPLADVRRKRRPAVEGNDASVMDHLVQYHEVLRSLEDLHIGIVAATYHRRPGVEANDATVPNRGIFRTGGSRRFRCEVCLSLLAVRCQR